MKSALILTTIIGVISTQNIIKLQSNTVKQKFDGRIINGEMASEKQFPYQVGFWLHHSNESHWCSGALISNRYILTTAHCVWGFDEFDVYLGAYNVTAEFEANRQILNLTRANTIVHENYNPLLDYENDIALMELPDKIEFTDHIQPLVLPKVDYATLSSHKLIASGWGRITGNVKEPTSILRYIEVNILEISKCIEDFDIVKPTNICVDTFYTKKSTCYGDSGGPLVHIQNGKPVLVGILSYGLSESCESGLPDVFTRVFSYLDWIQEKSGIRPEKLLSKPTFLV